MAYSIKNLENLSSIPGLSDTLLKNHLALYSGYVSNVNKIIENLVTKDKGSLEYAELKRRFAWEFNGMRLHELYFENLTSNFKEINRELEFFKKVEMQFGSFDNFILEVKSTALMRGIGWVIVYYDSLEKNIIVSWINEHDQGHLIENKPLLVLDLFEHAYMIDYGIKKTDYIETLFKIINWEIVAKRFGVRQFAFDRLASKEIIIDIIKKLENRGVASEFVETKEEALDKIIKMIPKDSEVMVGGSTTLNQIGFTDLLKKGKHGWNNLKEDIADERDPAKQVELRKKSINSEFFLGSVHAVTDEGQLIIASNTGSQIPSYAFSSQNVIWVVGVQKIVKNLDEGFRRIREYCFPLEDQRMKSEGFPGSGIGKILIFEKDFKLLHRKLTIIFVNEKLGF